MQKMTGREWFDSSASALTALLPATRNQLDAPGLGEWDVRSLLGHTCRAFTTVERYLSAGAESPTRQPDVDSPADYYRGASAMLADAHQVELRGKDAGRELGDDPAAAAEAIAQRVCDLVARTPAHAIVLTPVGAMRLDDYLPSRAFELTVHGLDLALATGQPIPERLQQNIGNAITLCSQIATAKQAVQLLRGITGRDRLPPRLHRHLKQRGLGECEHFFGRAAEPVAPQSLWRLGACGAQGDRRGPASPRGGAA